MSDFGHAVQEWWPLIVTIFNDMMALGSAIAKYLWRVFETWA